MQWPGSLRPSSKATELGGDPWTSKKTTSGGSWSVVVEAQHRRRSLRVRRLEEVPAQEVPGGSRRGGRVRGRKRSSPY